MFRVKCENQEELKSMIRRIMFREEHEARWEDEPLNLSFEEVQGMLDISDEEIAGFPEDEDPNRFAEILDCVEIEHWFDYKYHYSGDFPCYVEWDIRNSWHRGGTTCFRQFQITGEPMSFIEWLSKQHRANVEWKNAKHIELELHKRWHDKSQAMEFEAVCSFGDGSVQVRGVNP